jgi:sugar lactone lactonase YvrE
MHPRHQALVRTVVVAGVTMTAAAAARGASPVPAGPADILPSTSINGLAVGPDGRLYGADCFGSRVFRFDPAGPVVVAGSGSATSSGDGGPALEAGLDCPFGPALDTRGLFIVDHGNASLRLVDATGTISTFAGPGPFHSPIGIAIDAAGDILVGDRDSHLVRRVDPHGVVTTMAGTGVAGFSGDGGPATLAQLDNPEAVAVDAAGNVYVADTENDRIRRIDPAGIITTVAGNGTAASTGDGGPAIEASVDHPQEGLVVGPDGALYVTEGQRVRRIGPDGIISTFAGTGQAGHTGDGGPATAARLQDPSGLAMDKDGVLYVSSDGAAPSCVRNITPDGLIHDVWCHP